MSLAADSRTLRTRFPEARGICSRVVRMRATVVTPRRNASHMGLASPPSSIPSTDNSGVTTLVSPSSSVSEAGILRRLHLIQGGGFRGGGEANSTRSGLSSGHHVRAAAVAPTRIALGFQETAALTSKKKSGS